MMSKTKEVRPTALVILPIILIIGLSPQIMPLLQGSIALELLLLCGAIAGIMLGWFRSRWHTVHQDPDSGKIVTSASIMSRITIVALIALRVIVSYMIGAGYLLPHHAALGNALTGALLLAAVANIVTTRIIILIQYNQLVRHHRSF
ncbi:hypothetical protein [Paenibacillus sp. WLX2291]|uniref:hypothetical protein n=1 Tax=Paenibacillus sp. WLX2291 TaxID=3296934 RepID=UPI003983E87E